MPGDTARWPVRYQDLVRLQEYLAASSSLAWTPSNGLVHWTERGLLDDGRPAGVQATVALAARRMNTWCRASEAPNANRDSVAATGGEGIDLLPT